MFDRDGPRMTPPDRIGDRGSLSAEKCLCGKNHPVVNSLLGRADDMIVTPEGRLVGRMDPLFKGLVGVLAAQIIQHTVGTLEVLIVTNEEYSEKTATTLISSIRDRVGPSMKVTLTQVADIPRSKNGKLRAVISKLPAFDRPG